MTAKACKWTIFGIIALALGGWLVRVSLAHATVAQQLRDATAVREVQLQTTAKFKDLAEQVRTMRDREGSERKNFEHALGFARYRGLSSHLCESFKAPKAPTSLFSRVESSSGFFLLGDEDANVIAYVRKRPPTWPRTPGRPRPRAEADLQQTFETPDRRIDLPAKLHELMAYEVETAGDPGALQLGVRVTGPDVEEFIPFCDVDEMYESAGSGGPYNEGLFKNREYEITYGWPDLANVNFVKVLQERGIWLVASNQTFRRKSMQVYDGSGVQVVFVLASEGPWRVHPDYSYSRGLETVYSLEWDAQEENYLATPIQRE